MSLFSFGNIIYDATNQIFPVLGNIYFDAIRTIIEKIPEQSIYAIFLIKPSSLIYHDKSAKNRITCSS